MSKRNYNEIKENIINNFFNKLYKGSIVSMKSIIEKSIIDQCIFPFKCTFYDNMSKCIIDLGNDIIVGLSLDWKIIQRNDKVLYKLISIR